MGYETRVLRIGDVDPQLVCAWDAMPAGRGLQADYYDSHGWLTSWCHGVGPEAAGRLRIPAVLDGHAPLGLLPLWVRSSGRWESAGARGGFRLRYRPVLGTEAADEEALGLLAEEVSRAQVKELTIYRLPTRDPATRALVTALRQVGFHVHQYEFSRDHVTVVDGGWEEYRARFASYKRSVKRTLKRMDPWKLSLDEYGPGTTASPLDGFALYASLLGRSWKGSLCGSLRSHWTELVRRTEELGWCRIYVLRVAGVPAAAEIWFRLGEVASACSTVYDQRMAALGPGTIVAWWASERALTETPPPRLVDLLPGDNQPKARLAVEHPPLLIVEAARRTLVSGASFPLRRRARSTARVAVGRMLAPIRRARSRSRPAVPARVRVLEASPARPPATPVERLELDAPCRRFLAVAGGHRSPEAMTGTWAAGDTWWRVGEEPAALLRLGAADPGPAPVREVVLLRAGAGRVEEVIGALAAAAGTPLRATLPAGADGAPGSPIPVHHAVLPWPVDQTRAARSPSG